MSLDKVRPDHTKPNGTWISWLLGNYEFGHAKITMGKFPWQQKNDQVTECIAEQVCDVKTRVIE